MKTHVEVQLSFGGRWMLAELTDERGYPHPVISLEGQHAVLGTTEVLLVRPIAGTERELLDAARAAGYSVIARAESSV
jgi:hypothetical protein